MRVLLRLIIAVVVSMSIACAATKDSGQQTKPTSKASSSAKSKKPSPAKPKAKTVKKPANKQQDSKPAEPKKLPKLVDLGADKCIPCKKMKPILDELGKDYKGKLDVVFIDVWKDNDAGEKYKISSIPTQIFYDSIGKELSRHIGFFSKDDILARFKEHGVELKK